MLRLPCQGSAPLLLRQIRVVLQEYAALCRNNTTGRGYDRHSSMD